MHIRHINDKCAFFVFYSEGQPVATLTKFILEQISLGDLVDLDDIEVDESINILGWINYQFKKDENLFLNSQDKIVLFIEDEKLYRDYFPNIHGYYDFIQEVYEDELQILKNNLKGNENVLATLEHQIQEKKLKHKKLYRKIMELPQIYLDG